MVGSSRTRSGWFRRCEQHRNRGNRTPRRVPLILERLEDRLAPSVEVTPHGGSLGIYSPVLVNAEVETVFYGGSTWTTNPLLYQNSQTMNQFFNFITKSPYMDLLSQYYENVFPVGNVPVEHGSWTGYDYTVAQPGNEVDDAQIHQMLINELGEGRLPVSRNNYYNLYFVYLPPGVSDYECNLNGWGGYHSAFDMPVGPNQFIQVTYAVIQYPNYPPDSPNAIQSQEILSSHEMAEAITNPDNGVGGFTALGESWYANGNQFADGEGREIADLADKQNLKFGLYDGYWVQALWSNDQSLSDQRVLPAGTTNIYAQGSGKGYFPPDSSSGPGFDEDLNPLAGHLPTATAEPLYTVDPGQTITVPASQGLLARSFFGDPNGLPLQAKLLSAGEGSITLNPDGSFSYTAPQNGDIQDTLAFEATDGEFQSNPWNAIIYVPGATQLAIASPHSLNLSFDSAAQTETVTADVSSPDATVNGGSVTFQIAGLTASGTVVNGAATATLILPAGFAAGMYNLDASYADTPNANGLLAFAPSTTSIPAFLNITAAGTGMTVSNVTATFDSASQTASIAAIVTSPDRAVNEGNVTFRVGSLTATGKVINGKAIAPLNLPADFAAGTYNIAASYTDIPNANGQVNFAASNGGGTLTVQPPVLNVPPLLSFFDSLLDGIETVNADGTETITDSFLGFPLLVATFDDSGNLESVDLFGFINVTFLFA